MRLSRYYYLMIFLLFAAFIGHAQNQQRVEIKGAVVEQGSKEPVEQATVRLLNLRDSTFLGGVASGRNGAFTLTNITPGDYLLHISFIGYDPLYQPLQITGRTNPVQLGNLELSDGSIMLDAAVAIGKAPEVTFRNDTLEFNAESFKVPEGSTLADLLKRMPGVEVDSEGNVTVNGKSISKVLVDGKEFFSSDPTVATQNLPSNMIDKVQVLERLSEMSQMTGFDDGEEETVINLTVRAGMKQGWIGNVTGGYGNKDRYEGNAMISRLYNNDQYSLLGGLNNTGGAGMMGGGRGGGFGGGGRNGLTTQSNAGFNFSKEFSTFVTLGGNGRYNHNDNETTTDSYTTRLLSGGGYEYTTQDSYSNSIRDNIGADLRFTWKPDTRTTILFRPNFSYARSKQTSISESFSQNADYDTISTSSTNNYTLTNTYSASGRLEISRRLNDDGRILSFSLNGGISDSDEDKDVNSASYFTEAADVIRNQKENRDNSSYNYGAYVSWVEPFPIGENNFMQLTYSINQRNQENLKYAYDNISGELDSTQSKSTRNYFTTQRVSLSFKSVRAKFNYTIGFNVDPTRQRNETFVGDDVLFDYTQNVVNFSPTAQFRFNFSQRNNLRIDYDGNTNQPSITQISPVPDYSNTKNTVIGNPDLKPSYTNRMNIRYQFFKPESQLAMMISGGINYTLNDIVNYVYDDAVGSGKTTTTYDNMDGNYSGNFSLMVNSPLKNKKFTISSFTMASYSDRSSYVGKEDSITSIPNKVKSNLKSLTLSERFGFDYRSDIFDIGVFGNVQYMKGNYSKTGNYIVKGNEDYDRFNYSIGGNTTIYLPANFRIESDVTWNTNSGYGDSFELNEVLWNASLSKSFLRGNAATLRLRIYDILKQRSNISFTPSENQDVTSRYNTITSYFMVSFIYRFNIFSGGASMQDMFRGAGPGGGGRPPMGGGGPPGRGG